MCPTLEGERCLGSRMWSARGRSLTAWLVVRKLGVSILSFLVHPLWGPNACGYIGNFFHLVEVQCLQNSSKGTAQDIIYSPWRRIKVPWCCLMAFCCCLAVSDSSWPSGLQHTRLPCPSPSPGVYSSSCPLSRWCHPALSSSVIPSSLSYLAVFFVHFLTSQIKLVLWLKFF